MTSKGHFRTCGGAGQAGVIITQVSHKSHDMGWRLKYCFEVGLRKYPRRIEWNERWLQEVVGLEKNFVWNHLVVLERMDNEFSRSKEVPNWMLTLEKIFELCLSRIRTLISNQNNIWKEQIYFGTNHDSKLPRFFFQEDYSWWI